MAITLPITVFAAAYLVPPSIGPTAQPIPNAQATTQEAERSIDAFISI
jgi:hypothetical protein